MLELRYDSVARSGFLRLRRGRTARTSRLSPQAVAEYDKRGRLLAIFVSDLDPTAAEFLRMADEETLLKVIRAEGRPKRFRGSARPAAQAARDRSSQGRARQPERDDGPAAWS